MYRKRTLPTAAAQTKRRLQFSKATSKGTTGQKSLPDRDGSTMIRDELEHRYEAPFNENNIVEVATM
jgi:hypothetical protein